MSEVETTLARIKTHSGVKGHWITDGKGNTIRSHYEPPGASKEHPKEEEGARIVSLVLNTRESQPQTYTGRLEWRII